MRICIDPGHGGGDPGAIGPTGVTESRIVLKVCLALRVSLEQLGHEVFLTRATDNNVDLKRRAELGNMCDIFISVHCNSVDSNEVEGIETIYSAVSQRSIKLAECMQNCLINDISGAVHKNRGIKLSPSTEYARNLYVLNNVKSPSCLVELEFISNPSWEKILSCSPLNYAVMLTNGIEDYIESSRPLE